MTHRYRSALALRAMAKRATRLHRLKFYRSLWTSLGHLSSGRQVLPPLQTVERRGRVGEEGLWLGEGFRKSCLFCSLPSSSLAVSSFQTWPRDWGRGCGNGDALWRSPPRTTSARSAHRWPTTAAPTTGYHRGRLCTLGARAVQTGGTKHGGVAPCLGCACSTSVSALGIWGATAGRSVSHHASHTALAPRAHGPNTLPPCASLVQRSPTAWHAVR
jgi:hypothetical protein